LSFLDTRYDRYVAVGVGGVTGDVAGRRLTNAPVWSGRLWLQWERRLGRSWSLDAMVDTAWQTTVFFTPFNDAIQRQSPHALVNLHAEFGPTNGPWSVAAYARNLSNTDYITGTFATPPPAIGGRPGDARQLGLQFAVRR
jgi:iron complex outermembrane receptor protein